MQIGIKRAIEEDNKLLIDDLISSALLEIKNLIIVAQGVASQGFADAFNSGKIGVDDLKRELGATTHVIGGGERGIVLLTKVGIIRIADGIAYPVILNRVTTFVGGRRKTGTDRFGSFKEFGQSVADALANQVDDFLVD